jgi:hyperosmotically inducible protein
MNLKPIVPLLAVSLAAFSPFSQGADPDGEHTTAAGYVGESAITARVKTELAEEKILSLVNITVATDETGEVQLGGTADSQQAIDRAILIARTVKGVYSVASSIRVKTE